MRARILALAVAAAALGAPGGSVAARAAAGSDIGGVWLFRIQGGRGAVALNLGVPVSGVFTVRGLGVSLPHRTTFAVKDDAPVTLAFHSSGRITGTVPLEDETLTTDVGTLEVRSGKLGPLNQVATLYGRLTIGGTARRVVLHGLRRPSPVPDRSGGSHDGRVAHGGHASVKYTVSLAKSDRHVTMGLGGTSDNLGHPFYLLDGSGPVRVRRTEVPDFLVSGLLIDDQRDEIWGRVTTSQYGPATVRGRFTFTDPTAPGRPVIHAHVRPDAGRRFDVRALL